MADLLTPADRAEIDAAIEDVIDTFMKKTITLRQRRTNKISSFNEDRDNTKTFQDFVLLGLWVPDRTDDDAEAEDGPQGTIDDSEGVVYIGYQDLKGTALPLINAANEVDIIPNTDNLIIDGEERDIFGVNLVGPNLEIFYLVKLHYGNVMNKEKPING